MDIMHAVVLGIVEGITEFLPISSTGHLMLTGKILDIAQTEFFKSFEVAIQLGAILSVVVLYWNTVSKSIAVWVRIMAAFIPTAIVGALMYKVIKKLLLGNTDIVLWSLFIGGIVLIIFELVHKEDPKAVGSIESMTIPQAVIIGLWQSVSVVPGVSRAAATIVGGLFVGLRRKTIVEFSFLLAIPTMAAATFLDLFKSAHRFTSSQFLFLAVGFIVSFLVALAAIRFLVAFIKKHDFIPFGIYRVLVAVIFWFFIR